MTRGSALVVLTLVLVVAAGAAVAACGPDPAADRRADGFHRLVGGLGLGPTPDPARCEAAFDPRLCPDCSFDAGPVSGGAAFCPTHGFHAPVP